ncbi:hypothetical protein JRQ81_014016 [Phrynocephalus forsythii]|uniref:Ubiquitin-conjugating enzyme E2 T n=1 Tax=Phrynocephalus forsythii TaxID=171643 RepID=A0A9Q0XWI5_9SAUR|nr:hypothetical protein JRQ81_014016 [Phrynocephalus forsythii]
MRIYNLKVVTWPEAVILWEEITEEEEEPKKGHDGCPPIDIVKEEEKGTRVQPRKQKCISGSRYGLAPAGAAQLVRDSGGCDSNTDDPIVAESGFEERSIRPIRQRGEGGARRRIGFKRAARVLPFRREGILGRPLPPRLCKRAGRLQKRVRGPLCPGAASSPTASGEQLLGAMQRASRLKRELHLLMTEPPPGITCWQNESRIGDLQAQILGSANTPYERGIFDLEVVVPERYPFEPPKMRFLTPIYHPNIDSSGRICLDVLRLPPKGSWRPSLNIATLLTSIQLLMNEPNPDDPLMADISSEYKYDKQAFLRNARQWTEKYATQTTKVLETPDEVNLQSETNPSKHFGVSQKRKGSNGGGLSKKVCSDT